MLFLFDLDGLAHMSPHRSIEEYFFVLQIQNLPPLKHLVINLNTSSKQTLTQLLL